MPISTAQFDQFGGGLNLRDGPSQVETTEAIDLLNVEFTSRGLVSQRSGYANFTSSALTNQPDSVFPWYRSSGTNQLIAGAGTRLEGIGTDGVVVASQTGLASGPYNFINVGSGTTEYVYAGNGVDTLQRWSGTGWTSGAAIATVDGAGSLAMPKAGAVAVQSPDRRLVATGFTTATGGPNGSTTNVSRVFFSDAGDAQSWTSTNWVDLTPRDGEVIMGAVAWQDRLFIFKETKFFIFYGNTTSTTGTTEFNYQTVDTGVGLCSRRGLAIGPGGVYFADRTGIYVTTGGPPQKISSIITPFFENTSNNFFLSDDLNHGALTAIALTCHNKRLYVAVPTGSSATNTHIFVYDEDDRWWSLWDIPAADVCSFRISNQVELVFAYTTSSKRIGRQSNSYTNDAGTAISSKWRSGWTDIGTGDVKTIRSSKVWGDGYPSFAIHKDYTTSGIATQLNFRGTADTWGGGTDPADTWGDGSNPTDTWGGGGTSAKVRVAPGTSNGTQFSFAITNSQLNIDWTLYSLELRLRTKRPSHVFKPNYAD